MATQANVSTLLLRHVPLFALLPDHQLAALTSAVSRRSFPRGTTIIAAGDAGDSLHFVLTGALKVVISDKDDGREVILSMLGPGEYFGEFAALDDSARSASVVSLGPCELLMLSKPYFIKCLSENFEMTMTVMRCLVQRLREANRKIGSLALMGVYGRVARRLLEMSETVDGHHVVTGKVVKNDIAKMIGASRETVSRVMKDLYVGGFIEVRGNAIYLRDNIATIN
jgi:CRP/FNR family cyclic AMP-dependent transcriptional regulator